MNDRELLELAAKAAGYTDIKFDAAGFSRVIGEHEDGTLCFVQWNPLTDDGDALRLAVKIELVIEYRRRVNTCFVYHYATSLQVSEQTHNFDTCTATRRAIVRAAAEIGKNKDAKQ